MKKDTILLNFLESLLGRHEFYDGNRTKHNPDGKYKITLQADLHIGDKGHIYIRNSQGHVICKGTGDTIRKALNDAFTKWSAKPEHTR